ncbi:MAG: hypothetical protein ACI9FO_000574, partial [Methylophagaceae bacterium]
MTAPSNGLSLQANRTENWRARLREHQQRLDNDPTEVLSVKGRLTR